MSVWNTLKGVCGDPPVPPEEQRYPHQQYGQGFTISEKDLAAAGLAIEQQRTAMQIRMMQNASQSSLSAASVQQYNAAAQQANMYGNYAQQGTLGGTPYIPTSSSPRFAALSQKDLGHEAFSVTVPVLVDLWLQKYGTGWIDRAVVVDDEFYSLAAQRLIQIGRIEEHLLVDTMKTMLRVVDL